MKFQFLFLCLLVSSLAAAQSPLITKDGTTTFFSHSPIEDIEAINEKTTAAINFSKGDVVVKMLIKHFTFENALMQEHFNENYMESEKFPSAIFKGKLATLIDITQDGDYPVMIKGDLVIRGISTPVETEAKITVAGEKITATTKFIAKPVDYDIKIPAVVIKNIAEEIEVTSTLTFVNAKK
ncbi:YceI family protein [Neolewinella persica]|uniref:YceI family protein n=1 Tax=Neolewinella persica TaxID=70998 RepID=UPI0003814197|nr:YceI family protein [Neolewinella persica]